MDFQTPQNRDGIRFTWNYIPSFKSASQKAILPVSLMYTPLKEIQDMPVLDYPPVKCRLCASVLNPYSNVDIRTKIWVCPICMSRNNFPKFYADNISQESLPAQLKEENTTIEYLLPDIPRNTQPGLASTLPQSGQHKEPAFIFVLDTAIIDAELDILKESIQKVLTKLPENALVGFITYGKMVFVHELLGSSDFPRSFVFNGQKEYTPYQVCEILGLGGRNDPRGAHGGKSVRRFLAPITEVQFALNSILDDLQVDPWPKKMGHRPLRASGSALNIAVSLLEAGNCASARVCQFVGGAITQGPGMIVSSDLQEQMRSHKDIEKGAANTKYMKNAVKFYSGIGDRSAQTGIVIDLFISSLDQVGLLECKVCADKTGGIILMTDSFKNTVFQQSFNKYFEVKDSQDGSGQAHFKFGSRASLNLECSKELKICGVIGSCVSLKQKSNNVSDMQIGQGKTNKWNLGGLDPARTYAFYFDVVQTQNLTTNHPVSFQFTTTYTHANGSKRLRVTTVKRIFANADDVRQLAAGFDENAAVVLMSRYAVYRCQKGELSIQVLRWIDRTLIRLVTKFANFKKQDTSSFSLCRQMSHFPGFLFHLRRGPFIQTFNASPDESAYYRAILLRQNTSSSLVMIQPILLQYQLNQEQPQPVNLDISSLKNDVVLMLDTFFSIIIWKGETIKQWVDAGYHEQQGYQHVKDLITFPLIDIKQIVEQRFPVPSVIQCHPGHPQQRKLKVKVNPGKKSTSHTMQGGFGQGSGIATIQGGNFETEDVNFNFFMQHLIKLAVSSNN